jgi:hypothetical protein
MIFWAEAQMEDTSQHTTQQGTVVGRTGFVVPVQMRCRKGGFLEPGGKPQVLAFNWGLQGIGVLQERLETLSWSKGKWQSRDVGVWQYRLCRIDTRHVDLRAKPVGEHCQGLQQLGIDDDNGACSKL